MFTIEHLIHQITPFSNNAKVSGLLEKLMTLNHACTYDKNPKNLENLVGPLRTLVTNLLEEESGSEQDRTLFDMYYDILLALAELQPINSECTFTLEPIPAKKKLTLSTGHCFDIDELFKWQKQYDKWINPFDNKPFNERDINRINGRFAIDDYVNQPGGINRSFGDETGTTPLIKCIVDNDTHTAMQIIDAGADVNLGDKRGITPLMIAAKLGNDRLLRYLISHQAKINVEDEDGMTAWQFAECYHQKTCARMLVDQKALTIKSKAYIYQKSQLQFFSAIRAGNLAFIKPFIKTNPEFFDARNDDGDSASFAAIKSEQLAILEYLKEEGFPFSGEHLAYALESKAKHCFNFLLQALRAPLEEAQFEINGVPLVYLATTYNMPECLDKLIQYGADVNACFEGISSLFMATEANHVECFLLLKKAHADMKFKAPNDGPSLVYHAIDNGSDACLKLLAQHGASLDEPSNGGVPPICLAAMLGRTTSLAILLDFKANKNVRYSGSLPAHLAVQNDHLDCLKLLLKTGFDRSQLNDKKETILQVAAKNTQSFCYRFLRSLTEVNTSISVNYQNPVFSNHQSAQSENDPLAHPPRRPG